MEIELSGDAVKDFAFWKKSGNTAIQKKIQQLFAATIASPLEGIGKPEALKYDLTGKWSRRINEEHRMIYEAVDEVIKIYSLRGHYL
ncbi:Txe/YoeB family addiction module toxin [Mucilaginibacter sp. FT3.2]|uniref:Txe/YoeB family addiction module toxin n=1 Tax=Mucilaginibacter sp. FT3.2 TaxID=2723090 RepID=UPI00161B4F43|nr:Txe/YoeB family addiction module toxin [Mucilaginibacter sp. FT3.2]MBB6231921.1 toxin YoeB [Mucilaginibacter sp. FT3.2]